MTQNNLGTALERLGRRESGTARYEEAVIAYRLALEERTRAPLLWATTQGNLGNALEGLGEREGGTVRLGEAANAYHLALSELSPDTSRHYYQIARNGLEVTEQLLQTRR